DFDHLLPKVAGKSASFAARKATVIDRSSYVHPPATLLCRGKMPLYEQYELYWGGLAPRLS
ncbi:MAG: hypothetical protein KDB22_13915, partial [Planctomycetales bacterium]|nr:hypothetical protein [Planctomycetales bacterium]